MRGAGRLWGEDPRLGRGQSLTGRPATLAFAGAGQSVAPSPQPPSRGVQVEAGEARHTWGFEPWHLGRALENRGGGGERGTPRPKLGGQEEGAVGAAGDSPAAARPAGSTGTSGRCPSRPPPGTPPPPPWRAERSAPAQHPAGARPRPRPRAALGYPRPGVARRGPAWPSPAGPVRWAPARPSRRGARSGVRARAGRGARAARWRGRGPGPRELASLGRDAGFPGPLGFPLKISF